MKSLNITSLLVKSKKFIAPKYTPTCRKMSTVEDDVLFESVNNAGLVTLNRPKALNALNLSMVNKLYPKLIAWESEKKVVVVKGAGGKAFCSGGDVRAVTVAGLKGERLGYDFFRMEYMTNGLIGRYRIPYVALIDGIVMGGGVGLSVHGRYRVATERTLFAMPETQIGLFPDVGGSYFLPRLPGKLGLYLALTGHRLKGADVLKLGMATHYCDSNLLPNIEKDLLGCSNDQDVQKTLKKYSADVSSDFSLKPHLPQIDECFTAKSVEEVIQKLEKDGSPWALDTLKLLNKMSPTSLKVTMKELELGSQMDLQKCLQMEYRLAVNCMENKDFFEGVRALLIDKDQNPKWNPAKLSDVSPTLVDSHFRELPEDQELKHKL